MSAMWKLVMLFLGVCFQSSHGEAQGGHPCRRACPDDGSTMTCHYDFTLEWFTTMSAECGDCPFNVTECYMPGCNSADGVPRPIISINRQVPGPPIEVCENDRIIVRVRNRLDSGEGTTIHWHGLHQVETPWMDGVPMVTQCPIPIMTDFEYSFKASPAGTHFYHGHTGTQKSDGLFGALIIRQSPTKDLNWHDFDVDSSAHTVVLYDWVHEATISKYTKHLHDQGNQKPDSILVNGKGSSAKYISKDGDTLVTPKTVFHVDSNRRYRFRVIDAGFLTCPFVMSISQHSFSVIATDSYPTQQSEQMDTLRLHSGEMYDIVLETNKPIGNYWIYFKGTQECEANKIYGQAILRYSGAPREDPSDPLGYDDISTGPDTIDFTKFKSLLPNDETTRADADLHFFIALDMDSMDMDHGMGMDHAGMDHAGMDHDDMDHGGMGQGSMDSLGGIVDHNDHDISNLTTGPTNGPMERTDMDSGEKNSDRMNVGSMSRGNMDNMDVINADTTDKPNGDSHFGHNMGMSMDSMAGMNHSSTGHTVMSTIGDPLRNQKIRQMYTEREGPRMHHVHHPHINLIQYKMTSSPFLTQFNDVNQTALCNSSSKPAECSSDPNSMETCRCTHLIRVPLGAVVELIMFDQGVMNDYEHSMHIHGGKFSVVASERIDTKIKASDVKNRVISRNLDRPVRKDAVYVPEGGYTVIRFHAYNPGFWIFHCHIQFHVDSGMALVFQVGELSDMRQAPARFPTCGNYVPLENGTDYSTISNDPSGGGALSQVLEKKKRFFKKNV